MDYLDMIRDMADANEPVDESEAQAIINGARDRLDDLETQVRERHDLDGESDGEAPEGKPKSEHSRQERAEFYQRMRDEGKDPNEEWAKLPE